MVEKESIIAVEGEEDVSRRRGAKAKQKVAIAEDRKGRLDLVHHQPSADALYTRNTLHLKHARCPLHPRYARNVLDRPQGSIQALSSSFRIGTPAFLAFWQASGRTGQSFRMSSERNFCLTELQDNKRLSSRRFSSTRNNKTGTAWSGVDTRWQRSKQKELPNRVTGWKSSITGIRSVLLSHHLGLKLCTQEQ
ncbi:hypothetical protein HYDPIDRAFT_114124 [Hydnomerulius pinastri MD-312]|uniref:Uncharacterized protein n=1 Tax=Hydnomerulius pinastri MD-312 TaxID=994086 RepID=A0A0C9VBD4_9AGAM|nr:hypothetical protein HYDPIDRAFT_114124 [Hydnomerulius pinastri MD-312]